MRVLIVTNLYPRTWQPSRTPWNRAQFQELGHFHETRLISPVSWTDKWRAGRRATVDGRLNEWLTDGSLDVFFQPYFFVPRYWLGRQGHFVLRAVGPVVDRLLPVWKPDVLLGSWAYPDGWAAIQLGRRWKLPTVIKVHGSDILELPRHKAIRRAIQTALTGAAGVVAVSEHLAGAVAALDVPRSRIRVIGNGVDTSLFYPARRTIPPVSACPTLLFVGNLNHLKGIDMLIDACSQLAGRGMEFRLRIVGQGPLEAELRRRVERHGLTRLVEFVGVKSQRELGDEYRRAALLVLPSRSEGRPNVLLEAAACGLPSVATQVGGIPEMRDRTNSLLVPPEDADALASAIEAMLQSPGRFAPRQVDATRSHRDSAEELAGFLEDIVMDNKSTRGALAVECIERL
jgi:glycosyltransferase involved in cell wall biosynthesis